MEKKQNATVTRLVEGAMMLALAIVLSLVTPFKRLLPFGGSITLVSMLPICLFGIIGEGLFGWGLTPVMLAACIVIDYILAFTVLGLAGIFRKNGIGGWIGGVAVALCARFVSHFISGVVVFASTGKIWDELSFVAENKYIYSAVYNGAYMLPELILTVIVAVILFEIPQIRKLIAPQDVK